MANGFVTGWQHMLIDMENFNKETFIQFCDKEFYHLGRLEMEDKAELDRHKQKRIEGYLETIEKYQEELTAFENYSNEELEEQYQTYVAETVESNKKYRESFEHESERMKAIREFASHISPSLDYIWKELKNPELFQLPLNYYDDWYESNLKSKKNSIVFYTKLKDDALEHDSLGSKNGQAIVEYEARKKAFLESL